MNIYIYGNKAFKKDMLSVLSKPSIDDKLDEIAMSDPDYGKIVSLKTSKELEETIVKETESIFLIDANQIIKKTFLTKIFKFLNPKDGISADFLDKHEITIGVELDSVAMLTQYILDKLDTYKPHEITNIDEIREADISEALLQIN